MAYGLYFVSENFPRCIHSVKFGIETKGGTIVVYAIESVNRIHYHIFFLDRIPCLNVARSIPSFVIIDGRGYLDVIKTVKVALMGIL